MKYFHSDVSPALLCHKEGAKGLSLVLYGIRIGGFKAGKGSVLGHPYIIKPGYISQKEDVKQEEEERKAKVKREPLERPVVLDDGRLAVIWWYIIFPLRQSGHLSLVQTLKDTVL